jgi:ubiquinone/menaquinone biosynthesis C-methylase UbiE
MSKAQSELRITQVSGPCPGPSPDKFFEALTAYQRTAALKTAIELDLFTAIGDGQNTGHALATKINGSERGVRILCDCLAVMGFLTKTENCYSLTADSAVFLDKKPSGYAGSAKNFLPSPIMMEGFKDLVTVVRSGRPLSDHPFSGIEHPIWVEFARSMAPLLHMPARETAKLLDNQSEMKVLDVAAGHGMFGIAIAQRNAKARIVALDFPSVLTVAYENASRFSLSDRYSLLPGNALEVELGTGFDVVLLPNLLHSFERATNELLLKKAFAALKPKGRAVVVEFAPNEDRVPSRLLALFALMMLGNNKGDAYTVSEHRAMLDGAGFSDSRVHSLPGTPFTAIVTTKPQVTREARTPSI